jgi:hypothetical protein
MVHYSIGLALTDTLDDLISDERINPQLAMKILGNFDQAITEALQKNVKARLQFKVSGRPRFPAPVISKTNHSHLHREASIHTGSATKSGLS